MNKQKIYTSSPCAILRLVIMMILLSFSRGTTSATQFGWQEWFMYRAGPPAIVASTTRLSDNRNMYTPWFWKNVTYTTLIMTSLANKIVPTGHSGHLLTLTLTSDDLEVISSWMSHRPLTSYQVSLKSDKVDFLANFEVTYGLDN